jgi:uncharacterized protein YdaU (DUF1376 family)
MQLYVGDYLSDTLHLTTEQHGAYLLLLMTMWRAGAELPNDPGKLARIARVSPKRWPAIWAEISGFFTVDGDVIRNDRLTKEHQKAVSISQERKTAGKKGGNANALKNHNAGEANASDLPKHSQKSESYSEDYSEANASGEIADPVKKVFDTAITVLGQCGVSSERARSMVGKWRKDHPGRDGEIITAITDCASAGAVNPIPWIEARLRPKPASKPLYDLSKFKVAQ